MILKRALVYCHATTSGTNSLLGTMHSDNASYLLITNCDGRQTASLMIASEFRNGSLRIYFIRDTSLSTQRDLFLP